MTKYEDLPHIRKARELIRLAEAGTRSRRITEKPQGVITIRDILDAENALAEAQDELRGYSDGTDGLRQTLSRDGRVGTVIEQHRMQQIEHLQQRVGLRQRQLTGTKRAWLADLLAELGGQ